MSLVCGALAPPTWHGLSRELHNALCRAAATLLMITWVVWIGGCELNSLYLLTGARTRLRTNGTCGTANLVATACRAVYGSFWMVTQFS